MKSAYDDDDDDDDDMKILWWYDDDETDVINDDRSHAFTLSADWEVELCVIDTFIYYHLRSAWYMQNGYTVLS